jgi:glutamate dehydrogenase (NAD(P)+)
MPARVRSKPADPVLDAAAERLGLDENARELLRWPMREFRAMIPVRMDDGSLRILHGYRVQHNHARGPTIGGVRWHPDAAVEKIRTLAARMSYQTALLDLPLGGASGAVDCNPKALSTGEKERLARGYVRAFGRFLGVHGDVLIPDLYTTPQIVGWMMDAYEDLTGGSRFGTTAGKPAAIGGTLGQGDAIARSGVCAVRAAARDLGIDPANVTYAIQGFGNVGQTAAVLHRRMLGGGRLVAVGDSRGGVHNPDGIDPEAIVRHKLLSAQVAGFEGTHAISNEDLLALDVDVLYPAAAPDTITESVASRVQSRIVCELADSPTTPSGADALSAKGTLLIPDILAASGRVAVCYFEQIQNTSNDRWPIDEIHRRLEHRITTAYRDSRELGASEGADLRLGAYMLGISRVAEACRARGWC